MRLDDLTISMYRTTTSGSAAKMKIRKAYLKYSFFWPKFQNNQQQQQNVGRKSSEAQKKVNGRLKTNQRSYIVYKIKHCEADFILSQPQNHEFSIIPKKTFHP